MAVRIEIFKRKGSWQLAARRDSQEGTGGVIVSSGGDTPRDAAKWLVRQLNRIHEEIEDGIVALGLLTDAEIEAIAESGDAPIKDGA